MQHRRRHNNKFDVLLRWLQQSAACFLVRSAPPIKLLNVVCNASISGHTLLIREPVNADDYKKSVEFEFRSGRAASTVLSARPVDNPNFCHS